MKETKENANPKISSKSKAIAQKFSSGGIGNGQAEPIEERLIGFKKRMEGKKQ